MALLLTLIVALLMQRYYAHIWHLIELRLAQNNFPARNFSDLYPAWVAAKETLLHGRSPYSAEVTREIQEGYYGRAIDPSRPGDPVDEQRFAYPLYVVFIFLPCLGLSFATVKLLGWLFLSACAVAAVALWAKTIDAKLGTYEILIFFLAALATFPYIQGLHLQQLSLVISFLLAAATFALQRQKFVLAGVALALSTIKPQLSIVFISLVLLWSVSRWKERRAVTVAFLIAIVALFGASLAILPDWPIEFAASIAPYLHYTGATNALRLLFGTIAERTLLLAMIAVVGWHAVQTRSSAADSIDFIVTASIVLALTCTALPSLAPHNQVLLTPGFMLLAIRRDLQWGQGRLARALWTAAWLALIWPAATAALFGLFLTFGYPQLVGPWQIPLATNPLLPLALFAALLPLLVAPRSDLFAATQG